MVWLKLTKITVSVLVGYSKDVIVTILLKDVFIPTEVRLSK